MSNKCAPSFTGEVPSLPDFTGFFWKQWQNLKVLFMAFSHPSPEEIETIASKYIKMEFIFSNPLDTYFSRGTTVPYIPTNSKTLQGSPPPPLLSTNDPILQDRAPLDTCWEPSTPISQNGRGGHSLHSLLLEREKKLQDASLLSLISTLRISKLV